MNQESDVLYDINGHVSVLTLNRIAKHNAFNPQIISSLQFYLEKAIAEPNTRVILLKANGTFFSAGADLAWMQSSITFNQAENYEDALRLAHLLFTLHHSPKPTVVVVQGDAFGGGVGLVAACDIAIAAENARFCFSEVSLGLIPATISPYVLRSIGPKACNHLFISAEKFTAMEAKSLGLIQHCVEKDNIQQFGLAYAEKFSALAPKAIMESKQLINKLFPLPIDKSTIEYTASLLANIRVSDEGKMGLGAFLNKQKPVWK